MITTPQIMFRLPPECYSAIAEGGRVNGNIAPSVFAKSIVLAFLAGDLIEASKNADALFLGEKVAALVMKIEALEMASTSRHAELKRSVEGVSESVSESTGD